MTGPGTLLMSGATAVVLAGGKSSRMGRPKALLPFDGEPLIAHILRALRPMFTDVVVVAAPEQDLPELPAAIVRDEVAYQGPVAGIYQGLKAAGGTLAFVTSCDAPFLNPLVISHLVSRVTGHDVVVPWWEGRLQPLHAVYRTTVLDVLKAQLDGGDLRPVHVFDRVRTCQVVEDEIRRLDPEGLSFFNMNGPADYERALERWSELRAPASLAGAEPVRCTVELFGVARLLARTRTVELSLPPRATLSDALGALSEVLPALVGRVIEPDRRRLMSGCAGNLNGLAFVQDPAAGIRTGDRILILPADAGG